MISCTPAGIDCLCFGRVLHHLCVEFDTVIVQFPVCVLEYPLRAKTSYQDTQSVLSPIRYSSCLCTEFKLLSVSKSPSLSLLLFASSSEECEQVRVQLCCVQSNESRPTLTELNRVLLFCYSAVKDSFCSFGPCDSAFPLDKDPSETFSALQMMSAVDTGWSMHLSQNMCIKS